jgi:chemotaxis protein CheD
MNYAKAAAPREDSRLAVIQLQPGEVIVTGSPAVITTVLGSCVSLCLYAERTGVGAMCHCVLPEGGRLTTRKRTHFVDGALEVMLSGLADLGTRPEELRVKMFGGAEMFLADGASCVEAVSIGRQNVDAARRAIRQANLSLVAEDVGGPAGRRIVFYTYGGKVLLRRVPGRLAAGE